MAQQERIQLGTKRLQVQPLASLSWVKDPAAAALIRPPSLGEKKKKERYRTQQYYLWLFIQRKQNHCLKISAPSGSLQHYLNSQDLKTT